MSGQIVKSVEVQGAAGAAGSQGGSESAASSQLLGLRAELIYWEVNNEIRVEKEEYKIFCDGDKTEIATWTNGENYFGRWINELYITKHGLFVRRVWSPRTPYCWDETKIYFLSFE